MRIIALDYEGSHKNPRQGCPVQLGVAIMDGSSVIDQAEWLIRPPTHYKTGKPTREVDAYALRISGLSLERIEAEGVSSQGVCGSLQGFVKRNEASNLPVVAYNISYDVECYGNMLYDGGEFDRSLYEYVGYPEILGPKWICAYRWARRALGDRLLKFDLDSVSGYFGLARETDNHEALADAILAGKVFHQLTELSRVKAGAA